MTHNTHTYYNSLADLYLGGVSEEGAESRENVKQGERKVGKKKCPKKSNNKLMKKVGSILPSVGKSHYRSRVGPQNNSTDDLDQCSKLQKKKQASQAVEANLKDRNPHPNDVASSTNPPPPFTTVYKTKMSRQISVNGTQQGMWYVCNQPQEGTRSKIAGTTGINSDFSQSAKAADNQQLPISQSLVSCPGCTFGKTLTKIRNTGVQVLVHHTCVGKSSKEVASENARVREVPKLKERMNEQHLRMDEKKLEICDSDCYQDTMIPRSKIKLPKNSSRRGVGSCPSLWIERERPSIHRRHSVPNSSRHSMKKHRTTVEQVHDGGVASINLSEKAFVSGESDPALFANPDQVQSIICNSTQQAISGELVADTAVPEDSVQRELVGSNIESPGSTEKVHYRERRNVALQGRGVDRNGHNDPTTQSERQSQNECNTGHERSQKGMMKAEVGATTDDLGSLSENKADKSSRSAQEKEENSDAKRFSDASESGDANSGQESDSKSIGERERSDSNNKKIDVQHKEKDHDSDASLVTESKSAKDHGNQATEAGPELATHTPACYYDKEIDDDASCHVEDSGQEEEKKNVKLPQECCLEKNDFGDLQTDSKNKHSNALYDKTRKEKQETPVSEHAQKGNKDQLEAILSDNTPNQDSVVEYNIISCQQQDASGIKPSGLKSASLPISECGIRCHTGNANQPEGSKEPSKNGENEGGSSNTSGGAQAGGGGGGATGGCSGGSGGDDGDRGGEKRRKKVNPNDKEGEDAEDDKKDATENATEEEQKTQPGDGNNIPSTPVVRIKTGNAELVQDTEEDHATLPEAPDDKDSQPLAIDKLPMVSKDSHARGENGNPDATPICRLPTTTGVGISDRGEQGLNNDCRVTTYNQKSDDRQSHIGNQTSSVANSIIGRYATENKNDSAGSSEDNLGDQEVTQKNLSDNPTSTNHRAGAQTTSHATTIDRSSNGSQDTLVGGKIGDPEEQEENQEVGSKESQTAIDKLATMSNARVKINDPGDKTDAEYGVEGDRELKKVKFQSGIQADPNRAATGRRPTAKTNVGNNDKNKNNYKPEPQKEYDRQNGKGEVDKRNTDVKVFPKSQTIPDVTFAEAGDNQKPNCREADKTRPKLTGGIRLPILNNTTNVGVDSNAKEHQSKREIPRIADGRPVRNSGIKKPPMSWDTGCRRKERLHPVGQTELSSTLQKRPDSLKINMPTSWNHRKLKSSEIVSPLSDLKEPEFDVNENNKAVATEPEDRENRVTNSDLLEDLIVARTRPNSADSLAMSHPSVAELNVISSRKNLDAGNDSETKFVSLQAKGAIRTTETTLAPANAGDSRIGQHAFARHGPTATKEKRSMKQKPSADARNLENDVKGPTVAEDIINPATDPVLTSLFQVIDNDDPAIEGAQRVAISVEDPQQRDAIAGTIPEGQMGRPEKRVAEAEAINNDELAIRKAQRTTILAEDLQQHGAVAGSGTTVKEQMGPCEERVAEAEVISDVEPATGGLQTRVKILAEDPQQCEAIACTTIEKHIGQRVEWVEEPEEVLDDDEPATGQRIGISAEDPQQRDTIAGTTIAEHATGSEVLDNIEPALKLAQRAGMLAEELQQCGAAIGTTMEAQIYPLMERMADYVQSQTPPAFGTLQQTPIIHDEVGDTQPVEEEEEEISLAPNQRRQQVLVPQPQLRVSIPPKVQVEDATVHGNGTQLIEKEHVSSPAEMELPGIQRQLPQIPVVLDGLLEPLPENEIQEVQILVQNEQMEQLGPAPQPPQILVPYEEQPERSEVAHICLLDLPNPNNIEVPALEPQQFQLKNEGNENLAEIAAPAPVVVAHPVHGHIGQPQNEGDDLPGIGATAAVVAYPIQEKNPPPQENDTPGSTLDFGFVGPGRAQDGSWTKTQEVKLGERANERECGICHGQERLGHIHDEMLQFLCQFCHDKMLVDEVQKAFSPESNSLTLHKRVCSACSQQVLSRSQYSIVICGTCAKFFCPEPCFLEHTYIHQCRQKSFVDDED